MSSRLLSPVDRALGELNPEVASTHREFAESEIILPRGPRAGLHFTTEYAPFTALILDAYYRGPWRRFFARGTVQSGKTLIGQNIPALYHLCEIGEDIGFCAPTKELACAVFYDKVKPVLDASESYSDLWPTSGRGSRGGQTDSLVLQNGAQVRFLGAGGGDEQRSSHTFRVVVLTELDKMDQPGAVSREADPITQFEDRTIAYGDDALIYGECTTSYEEGRIYQETMERGTGTKIHLRCPYCEGYIYPDRSCLVGWQEAEDIIAAGEASRYKCQLCDELWDADDVAEACRSPLLVHKTQHWDAEAGELVGDPPNTDTFGVVWNFIHSPMVSLATVGRKEWNAARTQNPSDERELTQFFWSVPFEEDVRAPQVSMRMLAEHTADYHFDSLCATIGRENEEKSAVPEGCEIRIGTIDVQKRELYYLIDGYDQQLTCWSLAWGVTEIVPEGATWDPTEEHLRNALDRTRDICRAYSVENVWVDTGWRHEGALEHVVRTWCAERGNSVNALVGRGAGHMPQATGKSCDLPPGIPDTIQARLQNDGTILWFFNVDELKDEVYFRLFRERGSPGYHYFAREAANRRRTDRSRWNGAPGWIFSHYNRAKREITMKNGREQRTWVEHGRHDLWDCAGYSLAAAMVNIAYLEEEGGSGAATPRDRSSRSDTSGGASEVPPINTTY